MIAKAQDLKEGDWFQFEYDWPWHYVFKAKDGEGGHRNPNTIGKRLVQTQLYGGHNQKYGSETSTKLNTLNLWIAIPLERGVRISESGIPHDLTDTRSDQPD